MSTIVPNPIKAAAEKFSKYLNNCPSYNQQFPVPVQVFPKTRQDLHIYKIN